MALNKITISGQIRRGSNGFEVAILFSQEFKNWSLITECILVSLREFLNYRTIENYRKDTEGKIKL